MRIWPLAIALLVTLVALTLRRTRWAARALLVSRCAYAALIVFGLLYFPARTRFRMAAAPACEWTFGFDLATHSLTNYAHIVLFALFFLLTYAQLPGVPRRLLWSAAAVVVMGFLVEFAQGLTGYGHCRMRDLIPDSVGAIAGAAVVALSSRLWRRMRT